MISTYLSIAIGGALGSVARFWLAAACAERIAGSFPWGTLIVNVTGSFAIGLIAALTGAEGRWLISPRFREFLMIGVCGGYTTFSAFSLQTLELLDRGEAWKAGINVAASVLICLAAVWLGQTVGLLFAAHRVR